MPAKNTLVAVTSVWTQLTDSDVTALTFQNQGPNVMINVTVGAGSPPPANTGEVYPTTMGEVSTVTLAQDFPGVAGANRVWARVVEGNANSNIFVSHA